MTFTDTTELPDSEDARRALAVRMVLTVTIYFGVILAFGAVPSATGGLEIIAPALTTGALSSMMVVHVGYYLVMFAVVIVVATGRLRALFLR